MIMGQPKSGKMEELFEAIIKAKQEPLIKESKAIGEVISYTVSCVRPNDGHSFSDLSEPHTVCNMLEEANPEAISLLTGVKVDPKIVIDILIEHRKNLEFQSQELEEYWVWTPENVSQIFEAKVLFSEKKYPLMIDDLLLAETEHPEIFEAITPKLRSELNNLYIQASQFRALENNVAVEMRAILKEESDKTPSVSRNFAASLAVSSSVLTLLAISLFSGNDNEPPAPQTAPQEITQGYSFERE